MPTSCTLVGAHTVRQDGVLATITGVCVAALAFSIWWSKRSSMSEGMVAAGALPGSTEAVPDTRKRITVDEEEK